MALYRVLKPSFVNGSLHQEGAVIDYSGEAGSNLAPLDVPKNDQKAPTKAADK